jgi:excisionase family DNA binding protein
MLTLGQAAKEVGKSKTTLTNAIKSGRMSATKLEGGQYNIDPAELFRVYSPVDRQLDSQGVRHSTPEIDANLQLETDLLRDLIEQVKSERDDLRRRLDEAESSRQRMESELTRLTLLITDQSEPKASPSTKGILWQKLFGRNSHLK